MSRTYKHSTNSFPSNSNRSNKVRRIKHNTTSHTRNSTSNRNRHDPGEDEETHSLPVDSFHSAVAETDTDSGAGNAHGGGDGKRVLREDEDSESGAHFHGATSAGGVVGDLVAHDFHDVVAVGDETERERGGEDNELPDGYWGLAGGGATCVPGRVDDGPGTYGVTNVVGAVGK